MRIVFSLSIAMIVLMASSVDAVAASTQSALGATSDREAQLIMAEFANCVVAQRSTQSRVDRFLRTIPGDRDFLPDALEIARGSCLNAAATRSHSEMSMKLQPIILREILYPALYKRDFAKLGPIASLSSAPPLNLAAEFDGDVATLPEDFRSRRVLGDCIVRASPRDALSMIVSKPYEPSEDAAVEALKPHIAACLMPGTRMHMNRPAIRAIVGEAAYKLARAASMAPAAGT